MRPQTENSIRSALDNLEEATKGKVDTSLVVQLYNSPIYAGRMFILVEGPDDKPFYEKFFDSTKTLVLFPEGCELLRGIIADLKNSRNHTRYDKRYIGIVDSDFNRLDGIEETFAEIFRTDWHDHEAWLIYKEGNLDRICNEYNIPNVRGSELLEQALEGISNLSYIKWFHTRQKREENFKEISDRREGLNFGKSAMELYFGKSIQNSLASTIAAQHNPERKIPINAEDIENFKQEHILDKTMSKQLHVGHDIINAISFLIKKSKPQNIQKNAVYRKLLGMYTLEDFCKTGTYSEIKAYFLSIDQPRIIL